MNKIKFLLLTAALCCSTLASANGPANKVHVYVCASGPGDSTRINEAFMRAFSFPEPQFITSDTCFPRMCGNQKFRDPDKQKLWAAFKKKFAGMFVGDSCHVPMCGPVKDPDMYWLIAAVKSIKLSSGGVDTSAWSMNGNIVTTGRKFGIKNGHTLNFVSNNITRASLLSNGHWQFISDFYDSGDNSSLSIGSRYLYDATSTLAVDWDNRRLFDAVGPHLSVDWKNRAMYTSATVLSLNWEAFNLNDISGVISHDWSARTLYDNTGAANLRYDLGFLRLHGSNNVADVMGFDGQDLRLATDGNGTIGKGFYLKAYNGFTWQTGIKYLNQNTSIPDLLFQPGGGNVGVGTSSPDRELQVNGNVHINYTMGVGRDIRSNYHLAVGGKAWIEGNLVLPYADNTQITFDEGGAGWRLEDAANYQIGHRFNIVRFEDTGANQMVKFYRSSGKTIFTISDLPTSASGLPSGALWNNSGVLSVAP